MRDFLISLINKYDPLPAGRDTVESMIDAGEIKIALEIIIDNYYEYGISLTAEERRTIKNCSRTNMLQNNYLMLIDQLQ